MATIIGHTLAGLAVSRGTPKTDFFETLQLTALCVGMALLPDVDMLPGLIQGAGILTHGSAVHSLFAGVIASLAVALLYRSKSLARWQIFLMCFFAYSSHLALDYLARDSFPPYGIVVWWPFNSESFLAPMTVLMGAQHDIVRGDSFMTMLDKITTDHNLRAFLIEIALMAPFLIVMQGWRMRRFRRQATP